MWPNPQFPVIFCAVLIWLVIIAYQHMTFSRIKNDMILIKPFLDNSKICVKITRYRMYVFIDGVQSIVVISIIAYIGISYEKEDVSQKYVEY